VVEVRLVRRMMGDEESPVGRGVAPIEDMIPHPARELAHGELHRETELSHEVIASLK